MSRFYKIICLILIIGFSQAVAGLTPRWTLPKPLHTKVLDSDYRECITVKFVEGSGVRMRDGNIVSITGHDLAPYNKIIESFQVITTSRLFTRPENILDSERITGQLRSGKQLADLNLYYRVIIDKSADPEQFIDALNAIDIVEIAYAVPMPFLAEDIDPETPDFTDRQGYLYDAPDGLNAPAAWEIEGGLGETIKIVDIEGAWHFGTGRDGWGIHEDLKEAFFIGDSNFVNENGWIEHGDAVIGIVVAQHNGYGIDGFVPNAEIGGHSVASVYPNGGWPNIADIINHITENIEEGDIFFIELQNRFNGNGLASPLETWQENFDAIETATANGFICVSAAANGGANLDSDAYEGRFDPQNRHSGAILVGAGAPATGNWGPPRSKLDFSNYGQRVDLQGWGRDVVTLGYGDMFFPNGDRLQWYTDEFSGTSSATPMVVGSVAAIQGIYKAANNNEVMSAALIRNLLVGTGTPQSEQGNQGHIGPQPNLLDAIDILFLEVGVIHGRILDAENNGALRGAEVLIDYDRNLFEDVQLVTDINGAWQVDNVPGGFTFSLMARKAGYNDSLLVEMVVEPNEDVELNIALLHPEFAVSNNNLHVAVQPNQLDDARFTMFNDGNGPLTWSMELTVEENNVANPWHHADMLRLITQGLRPGLLGGCAFVNNRFYLPCGYYNNTDWVFILDRNGALIDSFRQFDGASRYGLNNITWDGELLWGGTDLNLYGFTTAGEVRTSFRPPLRPVKAVTYDHDRELLWFTKEMSDGIAGFTRDGQDILRLPGFGFRILGLVYQSRDIDGYSLYVLHLVNETKHVVHKVNPETAETLFVADLEPPEGGTASGTFLTTQLDPFGNSVFLAVVNNAPGYGGNRIDQYRRLVTSGVWARIDGGETSGVLNALGEHEFMIRMDAAEMDTGLYTGSLVITHNAEGGEVALAVRMTVLPLSVGDDGHIELPTEFKIASVYPNPFNSMATVEYTLPAKDQVSIGLYDINGRLITELYNGQQSAGRYQLSIRADDLPSGLYFVKMTGSKQTQISKLTLVR